MRQFEPIRFVENSQYDSGVQPCIAINNDSIAVEIHKSENNDRLFYRTADLTKPKICWTSSHPYDYGLNPSVSIHKTIVVEVHQSEKKTNLYYHVGELQCTKESYYIEWGSSHYYDTGLTPSISICSDGETVVEAHQSHSQPKLWYRVGKIDFKCKKINWSSSHDYDTGVTPAVAAIPNTDHVVEVHKSENRDSLYYRIGTFSKDKGSIIWKSSSRYDSGILPRVTARCNGDCIQVVEVHQSEKRKSLHHHQGTFKKENCKLEWSSSKRFDAGVTPSVAMNDKMIIAVHKSENYDSLYCSVDNNNQCEKNNAQQEEAKS